MTLILAWHDKSNVYISGDSAVTRENVSEEYLRNIRSRGTLTTTFGETLQLSKGKMVEESVIKIHHIGNRFIIGYAGKGDIALDVINDLEEDEELTKHNVAQKIKNAADIFGSDFQMVIGYFDSNSSVLLSFNLCEKSKIKTHSPYDPILLGNLRKNALLNLVSSTNIDILVNSTENNSPDRKLLMTNTFIQVVILRANLLEQSVGGFFCGAYLSRDGFFWQKDLGIIDIKMRTTATPELKDPNLLFISPYFIGLIIREGRAAILSSRPFRNHPTISIFSQYINKYRLKKFYKDYKANYDNWITTYQGDITNILSNFDYEYFAFICTDKDAPNKMTFVSKEALSSTSYFTLTWTGRTPTVDIAAYTVEEINPLTAEYLNQFHWLP